MKWLLLALLLLPNSYAYADHVISKVAGIDLDTKRVAHLTDYVAVPSLIRFSLETMILAVVPSDIIVEINSPGGEEASGRALIAALLDTQRRGVNTICVVDGQASSMAFNFLSFCNMRVATKSSVFLVHKVENFGEPYVRHTAKWHRLMAEALDKIDEPYRQRNAAQMHLSLDAYDTAADEETVWTTDQLVKMGYLQGVATIDSH